MTNFFLKVIFTIFFIIMYVFVWIYCIVSSFEAAWDITNDIFEQKQDE